MTCLNCAVALLLCGVAAMAEPPAGYRLTWADEFNGTAVDTAQWNYRTDSKCWSTQLPANVSVENGSLVLALKKQEANGMHYTGAGLISKRAFQFGYYESRLRINAGTGWHSSFWLMRHDGSGGTKPDAATLELDVLENDAIDLNSYYITTHKWQGKHESYGHVRVKTPPLSEFHTYGCEYTKESVKYFFDGELKQTVDLKALPAGDVHIWLTSIAAWLSDTKAVDDSRVPGRVEYDYVRFYEKVQ